MKRGMIVVAALPLALILACAEDEPPEVSVWSTYRGPTVGGASFRAVDASGPNDVWAVGAQGTILHYDGASWAFYRVSVTDLDLYAVNMTSGSSGWAVGAGGVVLRYHNGQWFNTVHLAGYDLYGVAFDDTGLGFAVGDDGAIFRYDGESWQDVSPPGLTADLRGVAVAGGGTAWAVGDAGTTLYYNGGGWQRVASPTKERLNAVAAGADGVYAAGGNRLVRRADADDAPVARLRRRGRRSLCVRQRRRSPEKEGRRLGPGPPRVGADKSQRRSALQQRGGVGRRRRERHTPVPPRVEVNLK